MDNNTLKLFFTSKNVLLAMCAVCFLAAAGSIGYIISRSGSGVVISDVKAASDAPASQEAVSMEGDDEDIEPQEEVQEKDIKVYVVGCVRSPGIVTLKKGQLLNDAINAAGGPTEEADIYNINLVYRLEDNVMVNVRSKYAAQAPANVAPAEQSGQAGSGIALVSGSGGAVAEEASGAKQGNRVNINTAAVDELDTLPGIGKETAKDIIAYREKNGAFKKAEDIMKVTGIKESRYNSVKDFITVE